jgi:hypothetical protein
MARVTAPGGLVAGRDGDYAAFAWYPRLPVLDDWLTLYQKCVRANGGEPDAGRHLLSWALAAGLTEPVATADVWCHATTADLQAISDELSHARDVRSTCGQESENAPCGWVAAVGAGAGRLARRRPR